MLTYSIGELIDKLAIVHNKIWHLEAKINELKDTDKENDILPLLDQVVTLNKLRTTIVSSIEEFIVQDTRPNTKKEPILIAGDGGLARVMHDSILPKNNFEVIGFVGAQEERVLDLPVYKLDQMPENYRLLFGVLNPKFKIEYIQALSLDRFITLKDGSISSSAIVDQGSVVMRDSFIMNKACLNPSVHIHIGSIIGHDCFVSNNTFVGPYCIIGGHTEIGSNCRIGMGARILPKLRIGNNVTIGAGAIVAKDVRDGITVAGNPAKEIHNTDFNSF